VTPAVEPAFAGGGLGFAGVPIAKDSSLFEAGFDLCVSPSVMRGLSYLGEFASGASPTSVLWRFRAKACPGLIRGGYRFASGKRVKTRIQSFGSDSIRTDRSRFLRSYHDES
jgi:hypothetical protein